MKAERLDVQLNFRATKAEQDRITRIAEKEDRPIAQVIRRLFRRGLAVVEKTK